MANQLSPDLLNNLYHKFLCSHIREQLTISLRAEAEKVIKQTVDLALKQLEITIKNDTSFATQAHLVNVLVQAKVDL